MAADQNDQITGASPAQSDDNLLGGDSEVDSVGNGGVDLQRVDRIEDSGRRVVEVPPSDNDSPDTALKATGSREIDQPTNGDSGNDEFIGNINIGDGDTKTAFETNEDVEVQMKVGVTEDKISDEAIDKQQSGDVGIQSISPPSENIDPRRPEVSQQQNEPVTNPSITRPPPNCMLPGSNSSVSEANPSPESIVEELEATPVADEPVYDATQVHSSWLKKHLRWIIVALVVIIVVLTVVFATLRSTNNKDNEVDEQVEDIPFSTNQPSQSSSPSQTPSWHPSFRPSRTTAPSPVSGVPSLQPSTGSTLQPSTSASPTTYLSTFKWKQQGETIVEDTKELNSFTPVALSADGLTMAIGYPGTEGSDNPPERPGYVKVYTRGSSAENWQQLGPTIEGTAIGDHFSSGLSISADGRTVAIGGPGTWDDFATPGYVQIYSFESNDTGSIWIQLGQTLKGEAVGEYFGKSTHLSSNGRIVAISDQSYLDNTGIVRVYQIEDNDPSSNWEQLGQGILGEAAEDKSGISIALSADGKTLAIGAHLNGGNGDKSGHVRVYHVEGEGTGSNWTQLGHDIDGEEARDRSGISLGLSANGRVVAIGSQSHYGNMGHVRVFHINGDSPGSNWTQVGQIIDGDARKTKSGRSVALSADGKTLAIGSEVIHDDSDNSRTGHVRVYSIGSDDSSWEQLGGHIIDDPDDIDVSSYALFQNVALSSDGETLAVGYVYERSAVFDDSGEDDTPMMFRHVKVYTIEKNVNASIS